MKLVRMINTKFKGQGGGWGIQANVAKVAHMEMFLKYIKPVLFLLFFAGPKLFHKGALSYIFKNLNEFLNAPLILYSVYKNILPLNHMLR